MIAKDPVIAKMSTCIHLLTFLAILAKNQANCYCKFDKELQVSVVSSTHLYLSWKDAFKDCNDKQIVATNVRIGSRRLLQIIGAKEAKVEANPCVRLEIMVTLDMKDGGNVWSQVAHYNADLKIESIYSGLLHGRFKEQICEKSNIKSPVPEIPEIPDRIKDCVFKDNIRADSPYRFVIPIINPNGLPGKSDIIVDCEQKKEQIDLVDESNNQQTDSIMFIVIYLVSFLVAFIVIVIAIVVCRKCFREKKVMKAQTSVNPDYAGAADYVYDEMGNYDTMEESSRRKKREVKGEVVDRCSVYGKEEEGWENALAIDSNPDYGE